MERSKNPALFGPDLEDMVRRAQGKEGKESKPAAEAKEHVAQPDTPEASAPTEKLWRFVTEEKAALADQKNAVERGLRHLQTRRITIHEDESVINALKRTNQELAPESSALTERILEIDFKDRVLSDGLEKIAEGADPGGAFRDQMKEIQEGLVRLAVEAKARVEASPSETTKKDFDEKSARVREFLDAKESLGL